MMRRLLTLVLLCSTSFLFSQEYRTYDGTGNNINNPEWGAVHSQQPRVTPVDYADNIAAPGGLDRPNPREVSNLVFQQDSLIMDVLELSDYTWVWGQFLDHDITLVGESETEPLMIPVPQGDPWFDPFNTGAMMIPMMRNEPMPGTGINIGTPRQHANEITSFIDASMVYGSDEDRADWLRTHEDGKMWTSANDLLPFNTYNRKQFSALHPAAPEMADPVGISNKHFVAGDVRANENPLLLAFHTLFVREHNRLCDELIIAHPDWDDDQLFQEARRIVGALIQSVTYEQWLPAMGVHLDPFTYYDPGLNPGIINVFSGAAFRLGHTLISGTIRRMDYEGNTIPEGDISLADAFFNPWVILNDGGLDPLFKGMGVQIQQDLDVQVVSDVRNFLFGPPGAGGLDLAAININRGRERGIPDFNTVREAFGMEPYVSFIQLTDNQLFADKLESLYGTIDKLDAWVGMLAEKHMEDALFGTTIMHIMDYQFLALRDGDRFYYENDPAFTPEEVEAIKNTTLADIITRNTNIEIMQENVFYAMPHEMLCSAESPTASVSGAINTSTDVPVGSVTMNIIELSDSVLVAEEVSGNFDIEKSTCSGYSITPEKNINHANGVTTLDMVLIRKHILGSEPFTDPIQLLAADANNSESISTLDMVAVRKVILQPGEGFENNTSWRFLPADITFDDPLNPWANDLSATITVDNLLEDLSTANFTGYKVGDVNFSADANGLIASDDRSIDKVVFQLADQKISAGETVALTFNATNFGGIEGYQFTLDYDTDALTFEGLEKGALSELSMDNFYVMEDVGAITTMWVGEPIKTANAAFFTLNFVAEKDVESLIDLMEINSRYTPSQAVLSDLEIKEVDLEFVPEDISGASLVLYQNRPNPFKASTTIAFQMPENGVAQLTIFDSMGRTIYTNQGIFEKGYNKLQILREDLKGAGIFYYQLNSDFGKLTKRMIVVD